MITILNFRKTLRNYDLLFRFLGYKRTNKIDSGTNYEFPSINTTNPITELNFTGRRKEDS